MKKILSVLLCGSLLLTGCAVIKKPFTSNNVSTTPATAATTTSQTSTSNSTTALNTTSPTDQTLSQKSLPTWQKRYSELKQVNSWTLNGSVSIQQAGKTNIASMRWQQQQMDNYNMMLFGPLSMGRVGIAGNSGSVTLTRTGKPPVSASSPESLMQQQLGWELPISNMYYWVRGIPAPGSNPRMNFDDQNHLTQLAQDGWVINYQNYTSVQQVDLPRTISMNNPRLNVRLVVKNWNI